MANRFQSIVNSVGFSTLESIVELDLHYIGLWHICDGMLCVEVSGRHHPYEFAKEDPEAQAILLLLNNMHHIKSAVRDVK